MPEPGITLLAAHFDNSLNLPISRIVIHATAGGRGFPGESAAGTARQTAEYFQKPRAGGSAHYVEDIASEEHCVPESAVAWHAPPNVHSLGIEICAEATYSRDQWLSAQVWPAVVKAAARARELADRHNVPKVKLSPTDLLNGAHGICGHVDVSQAWHQSSHYDPGPGFPWPEFMAEVNKADAAPTAAPKEDDTVKYLAFRSDTSQGGTGAVALAAPGQWYGVPSSAYFALLKARGVCGEWINVAPNEFDYFRTVYLAPELNDDEIEAALKQLSEDEAARAQTAGAPHV